MLEFALSYAALGWRVFPLHGISPDGACTCGQSACSSPGKHPATGAGFKDATMEPVLIRGWWESMPWANVGIATGAGLLVVDVDGPEASAALGSLPPTLTVVTGRGWHHYYTVDPATVTRCTQGKVGPHVDTRGDGGYVVAPPSVHASGATYRWEDLTVPLAPLPDWILALTGKGRPALVLGADLEAPAVSLPDVGRLHPIAARALAEAADAEIRDACRKITRAKEGERNATVNAQAFRAGEVSHLLPGGEGEAVARLRRAESEREDPTFTAEAHITIERAVHEGALAPRTPAVRGLFARLVIGEDASSGVQVNDTIIQCLADHDPDIYARGDTLVRVVPDLGPKELTRAAVHERVETLVRFERRIPRGEDWSTKLVAPPEEVAEKIRVRGSWSGIRPLVGVTHLPVLRPDGSLLQVPGYDPATGLLYQPLGPVPLVPEVPTLTEVAAALDLLLEALADFPFVEPRDRASALACLLSPLARPAIPGPVPLFAIEAPTPVTGKGLLADACAIISTGREAAKDAYPSSEEEAEKRLTTVVLEGKALHCWDNVSRTLGGDAVCKALTEPLWKGRRLGSSESVIAPMRTVFLATGNNLQYRADMHRRVLPIRLDSRLEAPEARTGFRHANLRGWLHGAKGALLGAALTLLRWHALIPTASRPKLEVWGSYEDWTAVVRSCLVAAGLPDPAVGRAVTSGDQADGGGLFALLLTAWPGVPFTPRMVVDRMMGDEALREAVDGSLGKGETAPRGIARILRRFRGRVMGGIRLEETPGPAGTGPALGGWWIVGRGEGE